MTNTKLVFVTLMFERALSLSKRGLTWKESRKKTMTVNPQARSAWRRVQGAGAGAGAQHSALGDIASRVHNSPHVVAQRKKLQSLFGDAAQLQEVDEEMLQGKFAPEPSAQRKEEPAAKPNHTGLPDNLKSGIESLSGMSMDNVKVHYNSSQPAQLNALAYAQGSDIHVAPGQEQHLPHEAWHVVQQAQGRVQPTMQMKDGVPVNDDRGLEQEADVMGTRAVQMEIRNARRAPAASLGNRTTQRQVNEEENVPGRQELLDLAAELEKNKSEISSVTEEDIDAATKTLQDAALNADGKTISEGVNALKKHINLAETAHAKGGAKQGTAQMSGWRFGLGALGFIFGSILPVIGNLLGAYYGYRAGRHMDWENEAAPAGFTPANIVFASMAGGNVGSIYFGIGRIRLTHNGGPQISIHAGIQRFTINNADYQLYTNWKNLLRRTGLAKFNYVQQLGSCAQAVAGAGGRLIEFYGANGAGGSHPSRGGPVAFNYALSQAQVNLLYHAASTKDNAILRVAMASDTVLAGIPIN